MFSALYDYISLLFSWRWPRAEGEVTAVDARPEQNARGGQHLRLVVVYKFSIGKDGPYTGETAWPSLYQDVNLTDVNEKLRVGQAVPVRYRPDDPSINRVDRSFWLDFEGL